MSTSRRADRLAGGGVWRVETLVVGAGQAGLAISRCLTAFGADHVVVERGRVAQRWRTARWDSLHLISPNWMTRLPAWSYSGPDPDGFMSAAELAGYLRDYAASFAAPVHEHTTVERVERYGEGFRVVTDQRTWLARNVVVASGAENRDYLPPTAGQLHSGVCQLPASRYRNPAQVPDGGVLVVGASASGVQIADELRAAGRQVVLSVGRHSWVPRRYRGHDTFWWMDRAGIFGRTIDQMPDARAARRAPSLQLSGRGRRVSLEALATAGVLLAGRLAAAADGYSLGFVPDLAATSGAARARLGETLRTIDGCVGRVGADGGAGADLGVPPGPPALFRTHGGPAGLNLRTAGIGTVIWATGYRPYYPWLRIPVLDADGQIAHRRGVTDVPGLYVLGLRFLYRRDSNFIDGVGRDAQFLAARITARTTARDLDADYEQTALRRDRPCGPPRARHLACASP